MFSKIYLQRYSHFIIAASVFIFGCGASKMSEIEGGPCTYSETAGQAKIVSLNAAAPGSLSCKNNPIEVIFDFTPDDPLKANIETDKNRHLTAGEGFNLPKYYVIGKGVTVGSTHRCIRGNITSGTCTPVGFIFPDIDLSDYGAYCF
jgi:hypothetical protein